jgi:site-specific recombinase XerD
LEATKTKKDCSIHALRHAFATHLLDHGYNIRYVQELLGHASIRTTEVYLHVTNEQLAKVESPLDAIFRQKSNMVHRTNGATGAE